MKFKKIKTKMLVSILPVIAVVLIALTLIAAVSCLNMVNTKVQESMTATLDAETGNINQELEVVKATAATLSSTVASSYKTLVLSDYEKNADQCYHPERYSKRKRYLVCTICL